MILVDFGGLAHPLTVVTWDNTLKARDDEEYNNLRDWEENFDFMERFELEFKARSLYTLLEIKKNYAKSGEEIVVAVDSKRNWRKGVFPHYKAKRKEKREEDHIDWKEAYRVRNEFVQELKENFFFKVLIWEDTEEDIGCEADDIIAILSLYKEGREPITIISDDSDFYQLHDIEDLEQYNFKKVQKTNVHACRALKIDEDTELSPQEFITLKIMNGDRKDGVPNCLNKGDIWLTEDKYVRFGVKTSLKILSGDEKAITKYGTFEDIEETEFFKRNESVLDLRKIPQNVQDGVLELYLDYVHTGSLMKIQRYLSQNVATGSNSLYNSAKHFVIDGIKSESVKRKNPFRKFINS